MATTLSAATSGAQSYRADADERDVIVVALPFVWGVRNVLRTGLAERLAERFRVIYAVPASRRDRLVADGIPADDIWTLEEARYSPLASCCGEALGRLHRERRGSDSDEVFRRPVFRAPGLRGVMRSVVVDVLTTVGRAPGGFAAVRALEAYAFRRAIPPRLGARIAALRPALALSTSFVAGLERPLMTAMRQAGVRTVTHVLSFDNVTSRGYVHLRHFDTYLVWHEVMATELQQRYGVSPERIVITGTPQFDLHARDAWSREATAHALGLDPRRPYVAYCANQPRFTPTEPAMVARLVAECSGDPELAACQWVIRPHPLDDLARWQQLAANAEGDGTGTTVRISPPWPHDNAEDAWAIPSRDELLLLGNTLRHAAATLQIASTIALDSMIVSTPVVSIGFHPDDAAEGAMYARLHESHHYRPILDSGAAPLARDANEMRALLREALIDRDRRRPARERLVAKVCGHVDGRSSDRVAAAVFAAVRQARRP